MDEDVNLLVAVEKRLGGRDVATPDRDSGLGIEGNAAAPEAALDANADAAHRYLPSRGLRPHWHPYVADDQGPERRFVQARFADLATPALDLLPEPRARLLADPLAAANDPPHVIAPAAVRETGLRLLRRAKLARDADGRPLLWVERRHLPLIAPPVLDLSFDDAVRRAVAEVPAP